MCEFISWVKRRDKIYFLTSEDIQSKGGQKIIKERGIGRDDYYGHGTIRAFYRIDTGDGSDKECTDFSTPKNFPGEITKAIKEGRFKGFQMPRGLLRVPLDADYEAKRASLDAGYEALRDALYADYAALRDSLDADHAAKRDSLDARYTAKRASLYAEAWDLFMVTDNRAKEWQ